MKMPEQDAITIRHADVNDLTDADYEMMAGLSRAAFAEYKKQSNLNFRGVTMTGEMVRKMAEKGTHFVILYYKGEPVAYGGSRLIKKGELTMLHGDGLACLPNYRGLKLGLRIAQLKEQWGVEQGADYCELDTSCKAVKARRFHEANGYKNWGYVHHATTNYYSVIMRKEIRAHWPEKQRRKNLLVTWVRCRLQYRESGEPRRFSRFLCRVWDSLCYHLYLTR